MPVIGEAMDIGRYEIHSVETGRLRLDGGAMFGVVPKALWEKQSPPDEFNRIQLSMRILIVKDRRSGRAMLVDTGGGEKWSPTEVDRFAFEVEGDRLGAGIASAGLREEDISDILITHLHFDHNGGLTRLADGENERAVPRFPATKVWVHRKHWEHAVSPTEKDKASFLVRDFEPVREAGLLEFVDGDPPSCPFDDLRLHLVHGHTPAQMLPWFVADGREMLYVADLFPTFAHLPIPWVMAYDNEPLRTMGEKRLILEACRERGLMLASVHDPRAACAAIDASGKKPRIKDVVSL